MFNQPTIRRLLSGMLLVIFAFSVTPRKFLHDWVANHKDSPGKFAHAPSPTVQKANYNCHTEDQVVESPFVGASQSFQVPAPPVFSPRYVSLVTRWHSARVIYSSLRGPPSLA